MFLSKTMKSNVYFCSQTCNIHDVTDDVLVTGNCLPIFGKKAGEKCYADNDCETGFVCYDGVCQTPAPGVGQFGEYHDQ